LFGSIGGSHLFSWERGGEGEGEGEEGEKIRLAFGI